MFTNICFLPPKGSNRKFGFLLLFICLHSVLLSCGGQQEDKTSSDNNQKEQTLADSAQIEKLMAKDTGSIPVEHFFKNPKQTSFRLSPNGEYLAWLAPYKDRLNVHVRALGEDEATRITSSTERDIFAYSWASNDRLVYFQDSAGNENYHIYVANRDGSNEEDLTPFDSVKCRMIDRLEDKPNEMIISMNKESQRLFDPYRLNIKTGDITKLADNTNEKKIQQWITDHEGKLRAAVSITGGVNQTILYRDTEQDSFQKVRTTNFKNTLNPVMFTYDNKDFYAISNLDRNTEAIVKIDAETGEEMEKIYSHPKYDVSGLNGSDLREKLTSVSYVSWKRQRKFLDDKAKNRYDRIKEELGEYEVVISNEDSLEEKFIVRTYSDRSLGSYYLYNENTDKLKKLADVNDELKEENMAEMEPVKYKSRDGLTIHGYLTTPKGKKAKNLPVVVMPHGGPWARDNWGFSPQVQFLANRGYAVFQMNFRGSTGYGKEFWQAGFKEWGQKMQNDITDGVHWLIEEGIADSNRIAIYGASYGGYATLAGVTFTPDLYRCAVDYVGVSNLFTFMETVPPYWEPMVDMFHEMVGDPEEDSTMMANASPLFHVDSIEAPLFIAQGAQDPRVDKNESDQIVKALRERGVNVPYMVKEDEGHGFSKEEHRFEFYRAMAGFLRKHMKAEPVEI